MDSYFIEWFTIYYYFVVHIVLNGTNCQQELFQAGLCVLLTHPCDSFVLIFIYLAILGLSCGMWDLVP